MKFRSDGAGSLIKTILLHQVISGGPVRVAIEERSDNAAIEHAGEGLMMRLGMPCGDNLVTIRKAVDTQAFLIGRAAAKADAIR